MPSIIDTSKGQSNGLHSSNISFVLSRGKYLKNKHMNYTLEHNQLAVIQRWSACTVKPVYSGHSWDTTSWLLYRGGLLIQWNLYRVVTLGTQPVV